MKKILIPVDFSEFSERAIEEGKIMAKQFGSNVVLLYVVGKRVSSERFGKKDQMPQWVDPFTEDEKVDSRKALNVYKESFGDMKDKVEVLILHGSTADEIIKTINNTDVDFVIMGSHGIGSALYRTLLGSTTNKVTHHSQKPILVVR